MPSSKTRSHSGCWTCRRRHRKCDGGRPNCKVCLERNIPCEGYQVRLRWGTGIASRGRFTGAEKPLPSNASGQKESQNTESRDSRPDTYSSVDEPLLQPPSVINDARDGTIEEQTLFQKFLDSGRNTLFATRTKADKLLEAMQSSCEESQACYKICVALQAAISCDSETLFLEYFDSALHKLRNELASSEAVLTQGTFLAGCLLCSICLMKAMPWTVHLRSLCGVLESPNYTSPLTSRSLLTQGLIEPMGVLEMPCLVLGRQSPPTHIWFRYCRSNSSGDGKTDVIEPVSGICRSLLDTFSCIDFGATEKDFWDWPGELGSFDHIQLWEAYRYAGILAIRRRDRKTPGNNHESSTSTIRPRNDVLTNRLLSCTDAVFRRKPQMSKDEALILAAFLYPIFIAGSELEVIHQNPGWRAFIEHIFVDELIPNGYIRYLKAWDLLREIWGRGLGGSEMDANDLAMNHGLELGLL